jgi:hypothetical protein
VKATKRRPKASGRVPGVRYPASPKTAAANRTRALKHGRRSRLYVGNPDELLGVAVEKRLGKIDPELPGIYRAVRAAREGDGAGLEAVHDFAYSEGELVRRRLAEGIRDEGVVIREALYDRDGKLVGERLKANPVLESFHKAQEQVGATADAMRLTKKSRGEGAVSDAQAAFLRRDADLRAGLAARRSALRESAIEVEAIEK